MCGRKHQTIHHRTVRRAVAHTGNAQNHMLNRLHRRQREPELMDQPGLDENCTATPCEVLQRINRISGTGGVVWSAIELALSAPSRTWRVLDVASGGGDVAIDVARRAVQRKIDLGVDGCDVSPFAVDYATAQAAERASSRLGSSNKTF